LQVVGSDAAVAGRFAVERGTLVARLDTAGSSDEGQRRLSEGRAASEVGTAGEREQGGCSHSPAAGP